MSASNAKTPDLWRVRGGVEHKAAALEACVVLDVFQPTRPEYVAKR